MKALLTSLAPLIGAEAGLKRAVGAGWAESATSEQLKIWKMDALELSTELEQFVFDVYEVEFRRLMRRVSPYAFCSSQLT
jgi:hypothetical protein